MRKYELMIILDNEEESLENNKSFINNTLTANKINTCERISK